MKKIYEMNNCCQLFLSNILHFNDYKAYVDSVPADIKIHFFPQKCPPNLKNVFWIEMDKKKAT